MDKCNDDGDVISVSSDSSFCDYHEEESEEVTEDVETLLFEIGVNFN